MQRRLEVSGNVWPHTDMKTENHIRIEQIEKALGALSMPELRDRFAECYGHTTTSRSKSHLIHRILWAVQRDAYGDISDAARKRALAIADDRDVRERFFTPETGSEKPEQTGRLTIAYKPQNELLPGTVLHRNYQGSELRVLVLEHGFEWDGRRFKSLSGVAREITGTQWNGRLFFGLKKGGAQ